MPPAEYTIRRKVEKAREWLKQGKSVTAVAFALGFSTAQYFDTTFKRVTNLRPRDVKGRGIGESSSVHSSGTRMEK